MRNQIIYKRSQGFTLIELMIATAVIAILSAVTIASFRTGEKNRSLSGGSDIIINAIRNAQNYTLAGKKIEGSTCTISGIADKSPQAYLINFTTAEVMNFWGLDKCNVTTLIETYNYPPNIKIQYNGYKLNGIPVSVLKFKFTPPFGTMMVSSTPGIPNAPPFTGFTSASITIEHKDGGVSKTVIIDGVSGRIGE